MKILVTGGAGFIGSHIVEYFQGKAEVRVLDNRSGFKHEFSEASILDRDAVGKAMTGVDYVFHLAALVSVLESVARPSGCDEINSRGTLIVLEEAAKSGVKKLVFSSSAAIYGDNPVVPKIETIQPEPKSPYASTKLEGERLCKWFADEGRLPTACLRYFNVFGPRQDPKSQYAAAVPIFIERVVKIVMVTGSKSEVKYVPTRAGDVKHSRRRSTSCARRASCRQVISIMAWPQLSRFFSAGLEPDAAFLYNTGT